MARGTITYGAKFQYFVDGKEVTREEFDRVFPSHPVREIRPQVNLEPSTAWPRLSDALGVGKNQKVKAEETFKKLGVPTEFVPDGAGGFSAKIRNNEHQIKVLKALGMHNNDGGYAQTAG